MTAPMFETLEGRSLFAANPYLDTSWNTTGVSTLAFRTSATDAIITDTQVVPGVAGTYVLARTKTTAQVRFLAANGTVRTDFGKNGLLLLPVAQTDNVKIAADTVGNLIMLAGRSIYRFDGQASGLNPNFAANGTLTLADFTGNIDMSVDESNKIYVTGTTKNGTGLAVERFISRGKLDKTFNGTGVVQVPLPKNVAKLAGAGAQGTRVQTLEDNTADVLDNDILLGGDLKATGYDGVQLARINYDGTLDASYGTGGSAYLLGQKSNEANQYTVGLDGVSPDGRASVTATATDNPGLGGSTQTYRAIYGPTGVRNTANATAFRAAVPVPADNTAVVLTTDNSLARINQNDARLDNNFAGLGGIRDIAAYGEDDDGLLLLTATVAAKAGRVNVALFLPTLVPDLS